MFVIATQVRLTYRSVLPYRPEGENLMRCANLTGTWAELECWLDTRDVLVLPALCADLPIVRLDSDCVGDPDDVQRVVDRIRRVIEHFDTRAVYVERILGNRPDTGSESETAVLTVRVLAGGAVHELKLFAGWYVDMLDASVSAEAAY